MSMLHKGQYYLIESIDSMKSVLHCYSNLKILNIFVAINTSIESKQCSERTKKGAFAYIKTNFPI